MCSKKRSQFVGLPVGQKEFSLGCLVGGKSDNIVVCTALVSAEAEINAKAFIRHVSVHETLLYTHIGVYGRSICVYCFVSPVKYEKGGQQYKTFGFL